MQQWSLQNKITLTALSQLLKILKKHGIENLPLDARTVLKTPRATQIVQMGTSEFWYDGIANNLIHSMSRLAEIPDYIELIANVDGISPLAKSSGQSAFEFLA